jgi:hypothetical protein
MLHDASELNAELIDYLQHPHHCRERAYMATGPNLSQVGGCSTQRLNEHVAEDGPTVFAHACRLGAEGIVSKKIDGTYQSGPCRVWIKVRNPANIAAPAVHQGKSVRYVCHDFSGSYAPCRGGCGVVCRGGYIFHPLYGAYGPYGGVGYWGAYTFSGWGYRR